MSTLAEWQTENTRQLAEAVATLRERLERLARRTEDAQTENDPPAAGRDPAGTTPAARGAAATAPAEGAPPLPSALTVLAQRFGLSEFEKNVLLLCAAMELDTRIPALCARAQADAQKPFPTVALALALFEEPSWDVVSPERPLRHYRLVEIQQSATQPLIASALRTDERIVSHLKGLGFLDERLAVFCTALNPDHQTLLSPTQHTLVEGLLTELAQTVGTRLPLVQLLGADGATKQLLARNIAARIGCGLYRLPVELLPSNPAELDALARLWRRESILQPLALYLDAQEIETTGTDRIDTLARFLSRCDGVVLLPAREAINAPDLPDTLRIDVAKPTPEEQQAAWAAALGAEAADAPARLAGQFNLNLPSIHDLARKAKLASAEAPTEAPGRAWDLCRLAERPRLDSLAQRIEPRVAWTDLVLPATELALLRQISAQVAQRRKVYSEWGFGRKTSRGLGISALFAGASGTGKTMAAEVLASDLKLNLYRIDLSSVVNKYIGETEKNLRRLFDAAEDGGAILFFDEADALFGKRSDVKDSHDRYANIEVNYLLQRIEAFHGLAILATNLKSSLDTAFLRRLRFIVNFPVPSVADRRHIWTRAFPRADPERRLAGAPLAELEYDRLARLNLTGGHIHNAALNAAFMAAEARSPVTMPLVLEAARTEFHKLNRPINAADFHCPSAQHEVAASSAQGGSS